MSRIVHFDISARNPDKEMKFFSNVFGWTFKKWDGPMDYWLIMTGDSKEPGIDGGLSKKGQQGMMNVNTIGTKNIDDDIKKIKDHGGVIIQQKTSILGVGYLAYFKDPEGNVFGLMMDDTTAK